MKVYFLYFGLLVGSLCKKLTSIQISYLEEKLPGPRLRKLQIMKFFLLFVVDYQKKILTYDIPTLLALALLGEIIPSYRHCCVCT